MIRPRLVFWIIVVYACQLTIIYRAIKRASRWLRLVKRVAQLADRVKLDTVRRRVFDR